MSTFVSVKDILVKQNPVGNGKDPKKGKRHASHEFQAYAYRLASDLNDVDNLPIYMRLAKNLKKKKKMQYFSYEHVRKEMMRTRNALQKKIIKKNDNQFDEGIGILLQKITSIKEEFLNNKVLFLGNDSKKIVQSLLIQDFSVNGLGDARKVTNVLKDEFSYTNKTKLISKDFFKHTYKKAEYSCIVVHRAFFLIPLESERKYIKEILSLLNVNGRIIIGVQHEEETQQKWKTIFVEGNEQFYLEKKNSVEDFTKLFLEEGCTLEFEHTYGGITYYIIRKESQT